MAATYIDHFHDLQGTTIKEQTKNLYRLLKQLNNETSETINNVIINTPPKSYLQTIFKTDMIIYFKKYDQMLSILQTDNVVLTKKILKHSWFIQKLIEETSPTALVNEIFSRVSFATRRRIINKLLRLCTNELYADELFDVYCVEYGVKQASVFLPICSDSKAKNILESNWLQLPVITLLKITEKNSDLLISYLKRCKQCTNNKIDKKILNTIAIRHPNKLKEFISSDVTKQHIQRIQLSRRNTKRIIEAYKNEVINNKEFSLILNPKQTTKSFGKDFPEFYLNNFPTDLISLEYIQEYHPVFKYTNHLKPKYKLNLFLSTFEKIFLFSVYDKPELLSTYLLELTEDEKLREKWIKSHPNSQDYLIYLPCSASLPLLKEKLKSTSEPSARRIVMRSLVKTCNINRNTEELLKLGKFIVQRYRNDTDGVISGFLDAVLASFKNRIRIKFELKQFDERHWEYLNELLAIYKIKCNSNYVVVGYLEKYLHHCYLRGINLREPLKDLLNCDLVSGLGFLKNKPFEKNCLELSFELFQELQEVDDDQRVVNDVLLLSAILEYNKLNPESKIILSKFGRLFESFRVCVEKESHDYNVSVIIKLLFEINVVEKSETENVYLEIFPDYADEEMCVWFMENRLDFFIEKLQNLEEHKIIRIVTEKVFIWLLENEPIQLLNLFSRLSKLPSQISFANYKIANLLRKYSETPFHEFITKKCKEALNSSDKYEKLLSIKYLSILLTTNEFNNLIVNYYPTEPIADLTIDGNQEIFQLQEAICKNLKNLLNATEALKIIAKFSFGDYLKISLQALYSQAYKVPENLFYESLNFLKVPAVSVKKHFVFLTMILKRENDLFDIISEMDETESNPAVIKILLWVCYKYFCKNLNERFLTKIGKLIGKLDVNDQETFESLWKLENVPKIYYPFFIQNIWNNLEKDESKSITVDKDLKFNLLSNVDKETMLLLDDEFCNKIVREQFSTNDQRYRSFFVKYLLYGKNQKLSFDLLSNLFVDYKRANSDDDFLLTDTIEEFLATFFATVLDENTINCDFLKSFELLWMHIVDEIKILPSLIKLRIITLHFNSLNENYLQTFSNKLSFYLSEFERKYGLSMIVQNISTIQNAIDECLIAKLKSVKNDDRFLFACNLFSADRSVGSCYVSLVMLKKPDSNELKGKYEDLVNDFVKCDEPIIRLRLFAFLKNSKNRC